MMTTMMMLMNVKLSDFSRSSRWVATLTAPYKQCRKYIELQIETLLCIIIQLSRGVYRHLRGCSLFGWGGQKQSLGNKFVGIFNLSSQKVIKWNGS